MKRWYAASDATSPVQVECAEHGYPNKDAAGRTQFQNTHFDTEEEAWDRLQAEAEARVSLAGLMVREARIVTRKAEVEAAEACLQLRTITDRRRR